MLISSESKLQIQKIVSIIWISQINQYIFQQILHQIRNLRNQRMKISKNNSESKCSRCSVMLIQCLSFCNELRHRIKSLFKKKKPFIDHQDLFRFLQFMTETKNKELPRAMCNSFSLPVKHVVLWLSWMWIGIFPCALLSTCLQLYN